MNDNLQPNFTSIPNLILDEWQPKLSPAAFSCLMVICRKTYGWHKKTDRIALSQFETLTGLSVNTVKNALKDLLKTGLVKSYAETVRDGKGYGINLNFDSQGVKNSPSRGSKSDTLGGQNLIPQKKLSKQINKSANADNQSKAGSVNLMLTMIEKKTGQNLYDDKKIQGYMFNRLRVNHIEHLLQALSNYLSDKFYQEKRAWNFQKFFNNQTEIERFRTIKQPAKIERIVSLQPDTGTEYFSDEH